MERLLGRKAPVGAAAHRGTAVEAGIVAASAAPASTRRIDIANARYTELTAFRADPRRDKERDALADMVRQGVALLAPWGRPDRTQCEKNWASKALPCRSSAIRDFEYDRHGLIVDSRRPSRCLARSRPSTPARSRPMSAPAPTWPAASPTSPTARRAIYQVEDVSAHIGALVRMALSLQRFLSMSADPPELAGAAHASMWTASISPIRVPAGGVGGLWRVSSQGKRQDAGQIASRQQRRKDNGLWSELRTAANFFRTSRSTARTAGSSARTFDGNERGTEIIENLVALFDFATVQVGWMRFEGERPDMRLVAIGDPLPDRPGEDYKQGVKLVVMLPGGLGLHEIATTATGVLGALEKIHDAGDSPRRNGRPAKFPQ